MSDENKTPEQEAADKAANEAAKAADTPEAEAKEAEAKEAPKDDKADAKKDDKPEASGQESSDAEKPKAAEAAAGAAGAEAAKKGGRGRGGNNANKQSFDNPLSDKPMKRGKGRGRGGKGGRGGDRQQKEFQETLLEVRRVTRVTTGGRQLAFRAIIIIGNGKGKIGLGVAKGNDVQIAIRKATHEAYKNIIQAPITEELTVPYGITHKYKSAIVKIMPATEGTGMKAGSSVRMVLELAGYNNILSKIVGTNNKLNNAIAAIQALAKYKVGKNPLKQGDEKKATKGGKDAGAAKKDAKVATKKAKKDTGGDDLAKIEGIGPKIAEMLASNGIVSYADLSSSKVDDLRKLLEDNKMSQHDPSTRGKQATLAKNGKRDELKVLQDELDGGKVVA